MGRDPIDALMDLVADDRSRITTAYFMMSEENVKLGLSQPWVSSVAFGNQRSGGVDSGATRLRH